MRQDIEQSKDVILEWVKALQPKAWMCRQLKCRPSTLDGFLKKWNIVYDGSRGTRGADTLYEPKKLPLDEYANRSWITSHKLKLRLYSEGLKSPVCEICAISSWQDKPLSMHLHHVDGDRFNNEITNLQILCPNCHAQTDSFAKPLHSRS